MVNEFWNNTDDSSEGGLGRCKNASPLNAPGKDAGGDDSDSDDEKDPKEDHEEETETQSGCSTWGLDSLDWWESSYKSSDYW